MIFDPASKRARRPVSTSTMFKRAQRNFTTQHIFEPLLVYEPGFNTDKYGTYITILLDRYGRYAGTLVG